MMKQLIVIVVLGLLSSQISCNTNVPVFIWGQKSPILIPALSQLNAEEFKTLVQSQQEADTVTLVFVENNLSSEDLSQCKLNTQTCFENLRKITKKSYLPNVENPVETLKAAMPELKSIILSNDGELSENVDGNNKVYFIYLDDIENSDDFATHDELINKIYKDVAAKHDNVMAIYTARYPSFVYSTSNRKVRQAESNETENSGTKILIQPRQESKPQRIFQDANKKNLLFVLSALIIDTRDIDLASMTVTVSNSSATNFDAQLTAGSDTIKMVFDSTYGNWEITQFNLNNEILKPEFSTHTPGPMSFACHRLTLRGPTKSVIFDKFQVQAKFTGEEEFVKFSDAVQCYGFFTAAIWAGLFVVLILLMILSCGLTWLMDINTMDRFDDPKGKTIIVNAAD